MCTLVYCKQVVCVYVLCVCVVCMCVCVCVPPHPSSSIANLPVTSTQSNGQAATGGLSHHAMQAGGMRCAALPPAQKQRHSFILFFLNNTFGQGCCW